MLGRMCLHDFYRWGNRHASGTHGDSQRADRFDCDMCESFGVHNVEVEDISSCKLAIVEASIRAMHGVSIIACIEITAACSIMVAVNSIELLMPHVVLRYM